MMNRVPKLLAVIDYQNDFVTGSLGFEGAAAIDDGIARLAQTYLAQGDHVLFTYDTHDDLYLETREGRALPIPHCNPNETGWRLYGKTQALCCETCANHQIHTVCKHTFGMPPAELVKLGQELPDLRPTPCCCRPSGRRRRSRWTLRSAAASTPCCMRKRLTSCRDCR